MAGAEPTWLADLAASLNSLKASDLAELRYEVLSDSLYWSDEIPDEAFESDDGVEYIRAILRYRTGIIIGEPDPDLHELWTAAMRLFPNWPGFDAARRRQDRDLQEAYRERSSRAAEEWADIPDEW
jgi:hypothetical protein